MAWFNLVHWDKFGHDWVNELNQVIGSLSKLVLLVIKLVYPTGSAQIHYGLAIGITGFWVYTKSSQPTLPTHAHLHCLHDLNRQFLKSDLWHSPESAKSSQPNRNTQTDTFMPTKLVSHVTTRSDWPFPSAFNRTIKTSSPKPTASPRLEPELPPLLLLESACRFGQIYQTNTIWWSHYLDSSIQC